MARVRLTERVIRAVELGSGEYLWDARVPGLGVRIGQERRSWVFRWFVDGRHRFKSFAVHSVGDGPTLMAVPEARSKGIVLQAKVQRGKAPFPDGATVKAATGGRKRARRQSPTLRLFWAQFIADKASIGLSEKTLRGYRTHFKVHLASSEYGIADLKLGEIQRSHLAELRRNVAAAAKARVEGQLRNHEAKLADGCSDEIGVRLEEAIRRLEEKLDEGLVGNGAANKVINTASAVFSHAIELGQLESNPAAGLRKWPTRGSGDNYLGPSDVGEAIELICEKVTSAAHRDALLLIMLTGARHDEVRLLTWDDVELETGELPAHLRLRKHKSRRRTKRDKLIPLASAAVCLLEGRRPEVVEAGTPVFEGDVAGVPVAELWPWWARVRVQSNNPRIRRIDVHGLRHSVATLLHAQGWSLEQIGRAYEHSSVVVTQRYVHETAEMYRSLGRELSSALPPALLPAVPLTTAQTCGHLASRGS